MLNIHNMEIYNSCPSGYTTQRQRRITASQMLFCLFRLTNAHFSCNFAENFNNNG